jgi:hypothetical protein
VPILNTRVPAYKKRKDTIAEWNTFKKGLNLLLRPTELGTDELAQADNIMLTGSGVVTGRWGIDNYFTVNATGSIRGFGTYKDTGTGTNEIFALSDEGYLAKKNGLTSTQIVGQSYPSGSIVRAEQLGGITYVVSKDRPMAAYTGATLSIFATLSAPTGVTATNFSGASGTSIYSWRITTLGPNGGETTGSTSLSLPNLPQNLTDTEVRVFWTLATGAKSGQQIYRGIPGDETFLAAVGPSISSFIDRGEPASETILSPITNTTGGVQSSFITKFRDRLLAVDANDRNKLLISGRFPNQGSYNYFDGGGYIYIDPDSGEDIIGIAVQPGSDKILVYKDSSHYAVELTTITIGNFVLLDPTYQPISTNIGASNQDTIQTVENDTFYFGRKGLYVTGYEPNFLNIIRTNEVSAKMRPYLNLLNDNDYTSACAFYVDKKYILSFPRRKECIVYDRERGAWTGPWKTPFGISKMLKYTDGTGTEKWVIGSYNDNNVYTFEPSLNTDTGEAIQKIVKTNKETFGEWSLLKIIKLFYVLLRGIKGTVTVNILAQLRDGSTTSIKSFTIEGSAVSGSIGWGSDMWGNFQWGTSEGSVIVTTDEVPKYTQLFKSVRFIQVEVTTTTANSNFELLNLRATASSQGEGSLASSSRV